MKRMIQIVCVMALVVVCIGCATNSQPVMSSAQVEPENLNPGTTAILSVNIKDRYAIVSRIEGYIMEEPDIKLVFNDKGEEGDVKAGDGVWSLAVDVPQEAPPGDFVLELTAYNSKGEEINIREKGGEVKVLSTNLNISITLP